MNTDDFEKRLQQQPVRQLPAEWRTEILRNAQPSEPPLPSVDAKPLLSWWKELLWPCPQAWAGLAAIWLVILALNFEFKSTQAPSMAKTSSSTPEVIAALREQHRLMAELVNNSAFPAAERPRSFRPGPRSEYRREEYALG